MRRTFQAFLFVTGYVALLVGWAGLIANRSYHPVWFGRYSTAYLLVLCVMGLMALLWKPLFDWLCRDSIWSCAGRTLRWRPLAKWGGLFAALLLGAVAVEWRMRAQHPWVRAPDAALIKQFHPFLQNELVPNDTQWHVNADGFRGDPLEAGEYDVVIFMLGGSTIFSHDVPYEQSHPVLLQEQLRARYPGVRLLVQNAGNEYHTTLHSLIKYVTRIRRHRPDIVIMWHGINDLCRSFSSNWFTLADIGYEPDYRHYLGPIAGMVRYYATPVRTPPLFHSVLLAWLKNAWFSDLRSMWQFRREQSRIRPTSTTEFPSLQAFENNLDCLLREMRADGVQVVMASEPSMYGAVRAEELSTNFWMQKSLCRTGDMYPDVASLRRGMDAFNAASRKVAEKHGVLFLDLDATLPKEPDYMFDDCHYTPEGNRRVAEIVADFLVQRRLIEIVAETKCSGSPAGETQTTAGDAGNLTDYAPEPR